MHARYYTQTCQKWLFATSDIYPNCQEVNKDNHIQHMQRMSRSKDEYAKGTLEKDLSLTDRN